MKVFFSITLIFILSLYGCKDLTIDTSNDNPENDSPQLIEIESDEVKFKSTSAYLTIRVNIMDDIPNSVIDYTYNSILLISTDSIPTSENSVGFDQLEEVGLVYLDRESKVGISSRSIVALEPDTEYFYEHYFIYDNKLDDLDVQIATTGIKTFRTKENSLQFGGVVFYDKRDTTGGWQYLVAAPDGWSEQARPEDPVFSWGCSGVLVNAFDKDGALNTIKINEAKCEYTQDNMPAATFIYDFEFNGYDDWFLPSSSEMSLLRRTSEISFNEGLYYSSTEKDTMQATSIDPWGYADHTIKTEKLSIRPIRRQ